MSSHVVLSQKNTQSHLFMDRGHIFSKSNCMKLKTSYKPDLFLANTQIFASLDVNKWIGVVWITCELLWCFISCSNGTHSLQRIHWWASDKARFLQTCYGDKTHFLYGLRLGTFPQTIIFGWTIAFYIMFSKCQMPIHCKKRIYWKGLNSQRPLTNSGVINRIFLNNTYRPQTSGSRPQ